MNTKMRLVIVLLFVATTLLSTSHGRLNVFNPIQQLRPRSIAATSLQDDVVTCASWRLTVETHNRQGRNNLVPRSCVNYVQRYMLEGEYRDDCEEVVNVAIEYAKSIKSGDNGKDVWVFDIDETTLSNLPYYERDDVQFGSLRPSDSSKFYAWVKQGAAQPVPGIQRLYNTTLSLGFKNVILTGLSDDYQDIRISNLKNVGYDNWEKIIFKGKDYQEVPTDEFKSDQRTKLVSEGYKIVGNIGDQWGDLTGDSVGIRTFKVPNPMYIM